MTKDEAFAKLARSKFRSRFKLSADDLAYIESVGLETVRRHLPPEDRRVKEEGPPDGGPSFAARLTWVWGCGTLAESKIVSLRKDKDNGT